MSNDLGLRSRRFTIRQLEPETAYELKIKANNPAGSTDFAYKFETVSSLEASTGTQLGIGSTHQGGQNGASRDVVNGSLSQLQVMLPVILGLLLVLVAVAGFAVCVKRSESACSLRPVARVSLFNDFAELDDRTKRQYLQSEDPFGGEKSDERIYAQVDTLNSAQQLPSNQMFYNSTSHFANIDTMGKIPRMNTTLFGLKFHLVIFLPSIFFRKPRRYLPVCNFRSS